MKDLVLGLVLTVAGLFVTFVFGVGMGAHAILHTLQVAPLVLRDDGVNELVLTLGPFTYHKPYTVEERRGRP